MTYRFSMNGAEGFHKVDAILDALGEAAESAPLTVVEDQKAAGQIDKFHVESFTSNRVGATLHATGAAKPPENNRLTGIALPAISQSMIFAAPKQPLPEMTPAERQFWHSLCSQRLGDGGTAGINMPRGTRASEG